MHHFRHRIARDVVEEKDSGDTVEVFFRKLPKIRSVALPVFDAQGISGLLGAGLVDHSLGKIDAENMSGSCGLDLARNETFAASEVEDAPPR